MLVCWYFVFSSQIWLGMSQFWIIIIMIYWSMTFFLSEITATQMNILKVRTSISFHFLHVVKDPNEQHEQKNYVSNVNINNWNVLLSLSLWHLLNVSDLFSGKLTQKSLLSSAVNFCEHRCHNQYVCNPCRMWFSLWFLPMNE